MSYAPKDSGAPRKHTHRNTIWVSLTYKHIFVPRNTPSLTSEAPSSADSTHTQTCMHPAVAVSEASVYCTYPVTHTPLAYSIQ